VCATAARVGRAARRRKDSTGRFSGLLLHIAGRSGRGLCASALYYVCCGGLCSRAAQSVPGSLWRPHACAECCSVYGRLCCALQSTNRRHPRQVHVHDRACQQPPPTCP
jgi:hypothetical protein